MQTMLLFLCIFMIDDLGMATDRPQKDTHGCFLRGLLFFLRTSVGAQHHILSVTVSGLGYTCTKNHK